MLLALFSHAYWQVLLANIKSHMSLSGSSKSSVKFIVQSASEICQCLELTWVFLDRLEEAQCLQLHLCRGSVLLQPKGKPQQREGGY